MRLFGEDMRLTAPRRREVYEDLVDMSAPATRYYIMVALSTTIAAFGLLMNSTAVVIGAMLVAPLMGPMFGIALGLSVGDRRLLWPAIKSEVLGMLLSVGVAALIGLLPLGMHYGSEIAARTQPTLVDIVIALAAGLAGAYALIDERVSPALPGVAVAVAVVPPLAVCGLGVAAARWDLAGGALLLFLANFLAIHIAAALLFALFGLVHLEVSRNGDTDEARTAQRWLKQFGPSLAALALVTWFMTQTLVGLIRDTRFSDSLHNALSEQVRLTTGAQLSDFRYERTDQGTEVIATVLTPRAFEPAHVSSVEELLRKKVDPGISLTVRSLISKDADRDGPVFVPSEELADRHEAAAESGFLNLAAGALTEQLKNIQGAQLTDVRRELQQGLTTVTAVVSAPAEVTPEQVSKLEQAVERAVQVPIHLIVRAIIARDADAHQYLYQPTHTPTPLSDEEVKLHERLKKALANQIGQQVPGAVLLEVRHARRGERMLVLAVARTPRSLEPHEVSEIEEKLRRHVRAGIDLIVRSQVGGYTAASGYLPGFDENKLSP